MARAMTKTPSLIEDLWIESGAGYCLASGASSADGPGRPSSVRGGDPSSGSPGRELHDHDLDRLGAFVQVAVPLAGGIGGQPVGAPRLPGHGPAVAPFLHDLQGSAAKGDDDPAVVVPVQAQGLAGRDVAPPHADGLVLELGDPAGGARYVGER